MRGHYEVKGLNKFLRQVDRTRETTVQRVDQEIQRSSLRVERKAKMFAPWDTGWLSNNIYSVKTGQFAAEVISPVNYSIWVELGTRYMAAQPFLYPALQEEHWALMRNLSRIVGK